MSIDCLTKQFLSQRWAGKAYIYLDVGGMMSLLSRSEREALRESRQLGVVSNVPVPFPPSQLIRSSLLRNTPASALDYKTHILKHPELLRRP